VETANFQLVLHKPYERNGPCCCQNRPKPERTAIKAIAARKAYHYGKWHQEDAHDLIDQEKNENIGISLSP